MKIPRQAQMPMTVQQIIDELMKVKDKDKYPVVHGVDVDGRGFSVHVVEVFQSRDTVVNIDLQN